MTTRRACTGQARRGAACLAVIWTTASTSATARPARSPSLAGRSTRRKKDFARTTSGTSRATSRGEPASCSTTASSRSWPTRDDARRSVGGIQAAALPKREPAYGEVLIRPNVRVPMRDGVKLATDVYLPAAGSRRKRV